MDATLETTFAERVALGAVWLDEHYPGWENRIDLGLLVMSDACNCLLGQLNSDYFAVVLKHGLMVEDEEEEYCDDDSAAVALGFSLSGDWAWGELQAEWVALIKARRP